VCVVGLGGRVYCQCHWQGCLPLICVGAGQSVFIYAWQERLWMAVGIALILATYDSPEPLD
jgi:hypothetical protein